MMRNFDIWLDGTPLVDFASDASFGIWLDGAPVLDVFGANVNIVDLGSVEFIGSTTLEGTLSQIARCSAHFIGFTTLTADILVVPYGDPEPAPPDDDLPAPQFQRSTLPPISGAFTRPFGVFQRRKNCKVITCCEDAEMMPVYQSDKAFCKTHVATGFFADKPLLGQTYDNLSSVDYAVACEDELLSIAQNEETTGLAADQNVRQETFDTVGEEAYEPPSRQAEDTVADEIDAENDGEAVPTPPAPPPLPEPEPTFASTALNCYVLCGNEPLYRYYHQLPAGFITDTSQAAANAAALAFCQEEAEAEMCCFAQDLPNGKVGQPYFFLQYLTDPTRRIQGFNLLPVPGVPAPEIGFSCGSAPYNVMPIPIVWSGTPLNAGTFEITMTVRLRSKYVGAVDAILRRVRFVVDP